VTALGLKPLLTGALLLAVTLPATAAPRAKTRFDGIRDCERLAAVQFKRHNPAFRRFVIDRAKVEDDKYADSVGTTFVSTIYHGRATYEAAKGPAIYRNKEWKKPSGPPLKMTFAEADAIPEYIQITQPQIFRQGNLTLNIPPGYLVRDQLVFLRLIKDAFPERPIYLSTGGGDGILSIFHEDTPDKYTLVQNVKTLPGARTMALDHKAGKVYLPVADVGAAPAPTAENPRPRPQMVPGSFSVLVVGE